MAYLHCHTPNCGWSQDDFWDKSYNPIRYMLDWEDSLLDKFNEPFPGEKDTEGMTYGQVVALEMERAAQSIREMKWHTDEEWQEAKDTAVCPRCGKQNFDID
jgi:rubredoxin